MFDYTKKEFMKIQLDYSRVNYGKKIWEFISFCISEIYDFMTLIMGLQLGASTKGWNS